jgi:hypothetical protein
VAELASRRELTVDLEASGALLAGSEQLVALPAHADEARERRVVAALE